MKTSASAIALFVAFCALGAAAVTVETTLARLAPEAPPFHSTAISGAQTTVSNWIGVQASTVRKLDVAAAEEAVRRAVATRFTAQSPGKTEVETLVTATLIQAVQENEKELQALAERVNAANAAKEALRALEANVRKLLEENAAKPDAAPCIKVNCGLSDSQVKTVADAQRRASASVLNTPITLHTVGELRALQELLAEQAEELEAMRADLLLKFQKMSEAQAAAMRRLVELVRAIGAIRSSVIANLK